MSASRHPPGRSRVRVKGLRLVFGGFGVLLFKVYGLWFMFCGLWFVDYGLWFMVEAWPQSGSNRVGLRACGLVFGFEG